MVSVGGKFLLIDGNSLAHRAFHALPPLSTKQGVFTNAVYGFTTMLFKALALEKPDFVSVAFDKSKITFRHGDYEAYKGKRGATPDELRPQFDLIKKVVHALRIPFFEAEGYEADDLIGTLVSRAEKEGLECVVVTGDRDALQLVSPRTKVLITKKGISEFELYDLAHVESKYGVSPDLLPDVKGLAGDPSDNIPGIPGIGEKTALRLVKEHGNLESIWEHLDSLPERQANLIRSHADLAFLSRKLARIRRDVPLDWSPKDCSYQEPDYEELLAVFQELEFKSLIREILDFLKDKQGSAGPVVQSDLASLFEEAGQTRELALAFVFDPASPRGKIRSVGLATRQNSIGLAPEETVLDGIREFISRGGKVLFYDAKNSLLALKKMGLQIDEVADDVLILAYLLNPTDPSYTLPELCLDYLGETFVPREDPLAEAALRAEAIYRLTGVLRPKIQEAEMENLYLNIELPLIPVLAGMEETGVCIDGRKLVEMGKDFEQRIASLAREIYHLAGTDFNINSPRQLADVLFGKLGLPAGKKTKTGFSTSAEVLEELAPLHPVIPKILEYRQLVKLKGTYVDGLGGLIDPETGKVHTTFHQTVTATGRLSSSDPNLQNIPIRLELGRRLREVFVPSSPDNVILACDYSQIELRVLAHISQDESLIASFTRGEDVHARTAAEVFGVPIENVTPELRRRAKAVNFGIVYGMTDYGLARDLGISRTEAKEYIERYFERHAGVRSFIEETIARARRDGYVTTYFNRRRYLPDLFSPNRAVRSFGERTAINTPIQGTAADIIKLAMIRVSKELRKRRLAAKMILQVHDELIFDVPRTELDEVAGLVKQEMEGVVSFRVPLIAEVQYGPNWYELTPWEGP